MICVRRMSEIGGVAAVRLAREGGVIEIEIERMIEIGAIEIGIEIGIGTVAEIGIGIEIGTETEIEMGTMAVIDRVDVISTATATAIDIVTGKETKTGGLQIMIEKDREGTPPEMTGEKRMNMETGTTEVRDIRNKVGLIADRIVQIDIGQRIFAPTLVTNKKGVMEIEESRERR